MTTDRNRLYCAVEHLEAVAQAVQAVLQEQHPALSQQLADAVEVLSQETTYQECCWCGGEGVLEGRPCDCRQRTSFEQQLQDLQEARKLLILGIKSGKTSAGLEYLKLLGQKLEQP